MRTLFLLVLVALLGTSALCASVGSLMQLEKTFLKAALPQGSAGANASVALKASFFDRIFAELLPTLEALAKSISVPGQSATHYSFNTFSLSSFSIQNVSIAFKKPSSVVLSLTDLSLSIPKTDFKVFDKIFDEGNADFTISCSGSFWGSITGSSTSLALELETDNKGELKLMGITPNFNFGDISVSHKLDGILCEIGQDIIQLFIGNLNTYVTNMVENKLPGKLVSILEKEAAKYLPKVPVKFASQPLVQHDSLGITVELLHPGDGASVYPRLSSEVRSDFQDGIFSNRDLTISINSPSFDDIVALGAKQGDFSFEKDLSENTTALQQLFPALYDACPACPMAIGVEIQDDLPPTGFFHDDSMTFSFVNCILKLKGQNHSTTYTELLEVYVNVSFTVENFTVTKESTANMTSNIFFQVALNDFALSMKESVVPNFNVQKLGSLIQNLLQSFVVPEFNKKFKGYPLHIVGNGFALDDWLIKMTKDSIELGADLYVSF